MLASLATRQVLVDAEDVDGSAVLDPSSRCCAGLTGTGPGTGWRITSSVFGGIYRGLSAIFF